MWTAITRSRIQESSLGRPSGRLWEIKRASAATVISILPMDETLALCAVDLSGRAYLRYDAEFTTPRLGEMDTEMVREFFYAVSSHGMMNLHLKILDGENNHHMAEALFQKFRKGPGYGGAKGAKDQGRLDDKRKFVKER